MSGSPFPRPVAAGPDAMRALPEHSGAVADGPARGAGIDAVAGPRVRRISLRHLLVLGVATAVAVALLVRVVDLAQVRASAVQLLRQPSLLAAFLASYTAAFWLRAVAWRRLLRWSPGTLTLFEILQAALFANHILPLKTGEVVRPYLLVRRGVGAFEATTTTLVARLLDFIVLVALAGVLLPLTATRVGSSLRLLALPVVAVAAGCIALLWLRASSDALSLPGPFVRLARKAGESLRAIPPSRIARAFIWTLPSWILEGAAVLVAARTMGIALPVYAAVAVTAVTILFQLVHVTPGGIGVYEVSMTAALALYGVPTEQGLTLAVLTHGMKFAYAFVIGGVCAALAAGGTVRSRQA